MAVIATNELGVALGGNDASLVSALAPMQFFNTDSFVYIVSEYEGANNGTFKSNPYKVLGSEWISGDNGGTEVYLDVALNPAAGASGGLAQATTVPWFYVLQNVGSSQITTGNHESKLMNLTQIKVEVGAQAGDWTDPS